MPAVRGHGIQFNWMAGHKAKFNLNVIIIKNIFIFGCVGWASLRFSIWDWNFYLKWIILFVGMHSKQNLSKFPWIFHWQTATVKVRNLGCHVIDSVHRAIEVLTLKPRQSFNSFDIWFALFAQREFSQSVMGMHAVVWIYLWLLIIRAATENSPFDLIVWIRFTYSRNRLTVTGIDWIQFQLI